MATRILMFGWEFPPFNSGGLGVACLGLSKALAGLGAEVIFVVPHKLDIKAPWARLRFADEGSVSVRAFQSPITPYITPAGYGEGVRRGSAGGAHDLFSEVARYASYGAAIAAEESFDIVYAHDWLSFGAGLEAKRVSGKPLVVHVHATEFDRSGGGSPNQHVYEIERAAMQEADRVIAVSEYTKTVLVERYGIPASKVRVVHNGIDASTGPQQPSDLSRLRALKRSGKKIVLFLGRLTLQKGADYFLRAAKVVLERDKDVVFVVSGSGDMERQLVELAVDLGVAGSVFFTGFLHGKERDEMYAAADLFVMPSVSEPFGIAPLEAMKLGTPVLLSKQSGVSEVVRHALKIDFWDVERMAAYILSVVEHPGLAQTLSENGRQEVDAITWADAALKVQGVMHELAH